MLKEIKVMCISDFKIYDRDGKILEGEFLEGNKYTAILDEELEEHYINSDEGYEYPVAHYAEGELVVDEDFKLVEIFKVKDIVCDYGVYQNDKLILILNDRYNANLIAEILNTDIDKKRYQKIKLG